MSEIIEPIYSIPEQIPAIGRVVHVVLIGREGIELIERPAIVVRVWSPENINVQAFTDGSNDGLGRESGIIWMTSVHYSEDPQPYTWHWPERI